MEKRATGHFKDIFCEPTGYMSAKRALGSFVLVVCLAAIVVQSFIEGVTDNIETLYEFLIVTSTCLLGLTSISNIFHKKYTVQEQINTKE